MYLSTIKQANNTAMKAQVTIKGSVFAAAKIRNNFWSTSFDKAKYAQGCESFYTAEFPTIKAAKAAIREAFNSMKSEDLVSSHDRYNGGEGFTYDSAICEIVRN